MALIYLHDLTVIRYRARLPLKCVNLTPTSNVDHLYLEVVREHPMANYSTEGVDGYPGLPLTYTDFVQSGYSTYYTEYTNVSFLEGIHDA